MGQRRKRVDLAKTDESINENCLEDDDAPASKKPRIETNASAKRSLFVRSLSATATTEKLTDLFSQDYPLKHATVVMDTTTKNCKGYGFVTFADSEDARRALDEFNGKMFQGRKMKIEIAQPRFRDVSIAAGAHNKHKSTVSAEAAASKKEREAKITEEQKPPKLIIRNLPWSIKTEEQLAAIFRGFGKVKFSTLPKGKDTQGGFGFVVMRGKKNAEKALDAINGKEIDGRILAVDWAVEKNVWEQQHQSGEAQKEQDNPLEKTNGEVIKSGNVDDDVASFMRKVGEDLESEDDSEAGTQGNDEDFDEIENQSEEEGESSDEKALEDDRRTQKQMITDNSTTIFVRNLPFTTLDTALQEHFTQFGPVRYARVVMDRTTDRPRGTGFVCFFKVEDAESCVLNAPRILRASANATKVTHSVLEDTRVDPSGMYTIDGRILNVTKAVNKEQATKLAGDGMRSRENRDKDKRRLYLLSEGTVAAGTTLYDTLAPSEVKMREDSAKQRKKLIQTNPTLHLSLTRLSIRNIPRSIDGSSLKTLAREAVVGFAKDVKEGRRSKLSKEEQARDGPKMKEAEKVRKAKGKGIVRQAKIVFEGREGNKVSEDSGAGRSRGYGFIEYSSHRWALMGLRWLNGHAVENSAGKKQRLIVEFAIENAQVVQRRKEREEKARTRSREVEQKRGKGEMAPKDKKRGKLGMNESMGKIAAYNRRISAKQDKYGSKGVRDKQKRDERLVERANIIQKKRIIRRNRSQAKGRDAV